MTPYGKKSWSTMVRVMACCLTNVDLSSVRASGIHPRAISQELPQPPITEISLKIIYAKFHSNLPGANELIHLGQVMSQILVNNHGGNGLVLDNIKPLPQPMLT